MYLTDDVVLSHNLICLHCKGSIYRTPVISICFEGTFWGFNLFKLSCHVYSLYRLRHKLIGKYRRPFRETQQKEHGKYKTNSKRKPNSK